MRALAREPLQREQAVGEQLRGGLVAGDDQQEAEADDLVVVERVGAVVPDSHSAVVRSSGGVAGGDRGAAVGDEIAEVLVEIGRGRDARRA